MKHLRPIGCAEELSRLREVIFSFYASSKLGQAPLFRSDVSDLLFFDYMNIVDPHKYIEILRKESSSEHCVGYLSHIDSITTWFGVRTAPAVSINRAVTDDELRYAFNEDPYLDDNASIQLYVQDGFVSTPQGRWTIWFSTYWELAIAAFKSRAEMERFSDRLNWVHFFDNETIIDLYRENPASEAPAILTPYLTLNSQTG
jgi:hypothetical protein